MTQENASSKRPGILAIVLSTIGVLAILIVLSFVALIVFAVHSASNSFQDVMGSSLTSHKSSSKLNYAVPHKAIPYIAGIKLMGEINDATASEVIDKLETAKDDSSAVGILLEVNSPGGSVVPSQEMYDEVKKVKAVKPVVVYVREMAASGAYYSSASASKIIANRGSIIGSIGVIMEGFEADKLIQFLKITPNTIKTGSLKDTGSPMRPMNNNDKKYLQDLIEDTHKEFVADVVEGRATTNEAMNFMSDGRVVLAPQALKLKLIDAIGSKDVALSEIGTLAKQKTTPELFYYENIDSLSDLFSQKLSGELSDMVKTSVTKIFSENETSILKAK